MSAKVWLITGASKGLGLILAQQLLARGEKVAATSRNQAALEQALGAPSAQFLPLALNLADDTEVQQAVQQAVAHFGRLDVVVNNAGFGQIGTLEELSDAEARQSFDINVFGMLNVIRAVMPHLRGQGSGHILNISSMAGIQGFIPGWGVYCASKFAVAGLTEALAAEVEPFGIKVTLVYPGHMRTSFLSADSIRSPSEPLSDYASVRAGEAMAKSEMNGKQMGDPQKAAAVLQKIVAEDAPPLHFFMGEDVYQAAHAKLARVRQDLEAWKNDTLSIGFDD